MNADLRVVMTRTAEEYPKAAPYHPSTEYPEYPFGQGAITTEANAAYEGVRNTLRALQLDAAHFGTPQWNPLGDLVGRGKTVLLKPNWVAHEVHGGHERSDRILDCLVTHTSVLRALIDYAFIAVGREGRVIVADAPIQNTDFDLLRSRARIDELQRWYRAAAGIEIEVIDLRMKTVVVGDDGRIVKQQERDGDPLGYALIDLAAKSELHDLDENAQLYRVWGYDAREILATHGGGKHEYLVSRSVLAADLLINVPKLKTHIKAGITAALKNLVGINGNKAFLPHYRMGAPGEGGDEYPVRNILFRLRSQYRYRLSLYPPAIREPIRWIGRAMLAISRTLEPGQEIAGADPYLVSGGSWYGNDTAWRMVVDLNLLIRYADREGVMRDSAQRRVLSVVDGIIAGERDGPLSPTARPLGRILGGFEPVAIDAVGARLIGFDWRRLALLHEGAKRLLGIDDLDRVEVFVDGRTVPLRDIESFHFVAPTGWRGHVEAETARS